jgi:hypothetical protein
MLTDSESWLILLIVVAASLGFMWGLNRIWPREKRREHNDQIGWQFTALGTTYAVILGFMLYAVWSNFGVADLNVDLEADSLVNIYRLADGLPDTQRVRVQQLTRAYANAAIQEDWPQMQRQQTPDGTTKANADLWRALMSIKLASGPELIAQDHALYELSALTQHRRTRILESASRLPGVLWCVLGVGGVITVVSACLFGSGNWVLHSFQVFAFTILIVLGLIAIGEINRPFQGAIHVSDYAFKRALDNMQP